jgi:diketogulonate reductase-like aldo/keto reductase
MTRLLSLLVSTVFLLSAARPARDDERLIGWKGETYKRSPLAAMDASVLLAGDTRMPRVGFGTAGLADGTAAAVGSALLAGYRLLDSAQAREWYREDLVGEALASAALPRDSLWLTSKVHPRHLGFNATLSQVRVSLRELRTEYLDLLLLHYPECWGTLCPGVTPEGTWRDSWRALEEAQRLRLVRHIGVSNFDTRQLGELLEWAVTPPAVVQSYSDPYSQNRELQRLCAAHGIAFQAYSSLGSQWWGRGYRDNPVLRAAPVLGAAQAHSRGAAQVVLRWALQKGQAVIPKSGNAEHIASNLALFDFSLSEEEVAAIDAMDGVVPEKV